MKYDNNEEQVSLTPFGLLTADLDDDQAQRVLDALELYMRRHGLALAVVGARLEFVFDEEGRK